MVKSFSVFIRNYSLIYISVFISNKFLCRRYYSTYWKIVWSISFKNSGFKVSIYKLIYKSVINWCSRFSDYSRLFMVGIITFLYSKFEKLYTLLHWSWSRILRLKSPAIWKGLRLFLLSLKFLLKIFQTVQ